MNLYVNSKKQNNFIAKFALLKKNLQRKKIKKIDKFLILKNKLPLEEKS